MLTGLFLLAMALQDSAPDCRAGPPRTWVTNADYPKEARQKGMEGDVEFELEVSVKGCVTACKVTRSSGWPILDTRTCELMQERARFNPSVDKNGVPVAATWKDVFSWRLH